MANKLLWKVHTGSLLSEILNNNTTSVLHIPIKTFAMLLTQVSVRASQLNDPILNDLMCKLSLYEIADPYSKDYDPEKVEEIEKLSLLKKGENND